MAKAVLKVAEHQNGLEAQNPPVWWKITKVGTFKLSINGQHEQNSISNLIHNSQI